MPIINSFEIVRYKEIPIDVPAGMVEDGRYGLFELNTPQSNPRGTGDFFGIVKKVVLLGEVIEHTLDTGKLNFYQFNNLTQAEFEQLLADPNNQYGLKLNPQTRGVPKTIGWVELGKTRPSFYYEDCVLSQSGLDGKFTKSENYYVVDDLQLGITTVSGQGQGQPALQPTGNWNYGKAFYNWGVSPYPNQERIEFYDYIRAALRKGRLPDGRTVTEITSPPLVDIPMLLATREEHFDSLTNTYTLPPSFSDKKDSNGNPIEKKVYGRLRGGGNVLGFKSLLLPVSAGECGPTGGVTGPPGPPPPPGPDVDTTGLDEEQLGDDTLSKRLISLNPCGDKPKLLNLPPYEQISSEEINGLSSKFISYNLIKDPGDGTGFDINLAEPIDNDEKEIHELRKNHQTRELALGIMDPREFTGDSYEIPAGTIHALLNTKTCTYDLYPALRDKDGDIPEPIGPVLSYYFYRTRKNMIQRFGVLDSPLKNLGTGSDGYYRYSDGNSYVELLGEAVFGCGDPLSFGLDIPEVVVQISDNYKSSYGKPQTINSYLADISYGIPSGVTQIRTENQRTGTQQRNLLEQWQKTIHPIYELIKDVNSEIDYQQIDDAISIEVSGSYSNIINNNSRPGISWDWLLSRGFGQFSIGVTYKFNVNPSDGYVSKVKFDVIGFLKFWAAVGALAIDWVDSWFKKESKPILSVEERRLGRSPRRLHKKGNLVLVSKSGLYFTTRNPCEQIFLGFADDYYNIHPNGRPALIERLSKTDVTGSLIITKSKRNVSVNNNQLLSQSSNKSSTEIIPSLFPRIKKYGRNPLLDIFYLNVITPGIKYGGDGTTTNRYSQERRFSHPSRVPFRRSSSTKETEWSDLKYGQFPSMFPQNWNAFWQNDNFDRFTDEQNELSYGDKFWLNRVKNTILELKDRWSLHVDYVDGDYLKPTVVLQDKTRILDLYFGLMELHVKGVSWREILQYVDFALTCISGGKYSEKLNTDKLETLWKIVFNRLNEIQQKGALRQNEFYVGSYDFGEVLVIEKDQNVSNVLQSLSSMYQTGVLIQNRSDSPIKIEYINIVSDESVTDIYDRNASDYFFLNDPITRSWSRTNPPETIPPTKVNTTFYEIPVYFIPYMAQPEFEYTANIVVGVRENNGEVVEYNGTISGKCITDRIIESDDESLTNPLLLPESLDFGYNQVGTSLKMELNYSNYNYHQTITLKSFEIQQQFAYETDGSNQREMNVEKPFVFSTTPNAKINVEKIFLPLKNDELPPIFKVEVSFKPIESEKVYTANLVVKYEVSGRTKFENSKQFEKVIQLTGVSV